MTNLYSAQLEDLYIHKVGNKARNEKLILSKDSFPLNDEIHPLLKEFFFKQFRTKDLNFYKFSEDSKLKEHLINQGIFQALKQNIARHLFSCGNHPHIKSGEVYTCRINDILIDNERLSGIGIFKSEMKHDFIQFEEKETRIDAILEQGVELSKLDKGAIITNEQEPRILFIDSNRYDTKYWIESFLGIEELDDDRYKTKNYLKFCENFAKDVVKANEGEQGKIDVFNKTLNHFASLDEFNESVFLQEVLSEEYTDEFEQYKEQFSEKYNLGESKSFLISNESVTEVTKKSKNEISLDTGLSIKVAKGTLAASQYLEKGWDEERQMYYYLSYFHKEN